ncbi:hypothetical protein FA95DRAFT_1575714 [Auriscalpium vulgare]|uniref:Uncharacterized protein n=1 Tax=Auriscalpium vulgare TaxID=40419 RepID=A0ACB8REG6_9AGAM|nr:hypothetical protein FA95DRAFT_1575714 [Auriscalpium vulgare]
MSVRHSGPSHSQTLPSFSVAFSNSSLDRLSGQNALPPIHSQSPPDRNVYPSDLPQHSDHPPGENGAQHTNGRKRSHPEYRDDGSDNRGHRSPRLVRVKEEHDELVDDPPYPSRTSRSQPDTSQPLPPQTQAPTSKKRRMTVSGLGLDTTSSGGSADAPLSPVVVGIPHMRDDPGAMEQVRSMLVVRQNQKALIEQRRGSLGGPTAVPPQPPTQGPSSTQPQPPAPRTSARSPNMNGNRVRHSDPAVRPPSPPPIIVPSQQPLPSAPTPHPSALPPPPISFARRRATNSVGGGKKAKPADILISPRDTRTQPVIQSAPPQQGGRFSMMSLPNLPNVQQVPAIRRTVPGNVPPTPTRLSMRNSITASTSSSSLTVPTIAPGGSGHSPAVAASVPIATTLVPPTPATLHRPDYTSPRSAFLAPFEMFYDALRDAKELKTWLADQLAKSQVLQANLSQTQERMDSVVEAAVERRVGGMREEIARLNKRVEELEQARPARPEPFGSALMRRRSVANGEVPLLSASVSSVRPPLFIRDPAPAPSLPPSNFADTYTFPPVHPPLSSQQQRERELDSRSAADADSPAPVDISRRQSVSAIRMDPPPPPSAPGDVPGVRSPPIALRGSVSAPQTRPAPVRRVSSQQVQRLAAEQPSRSHSPMDDS